MKNKRKKKGSTGNENIKEKSIKWMYKKESGMKMVGSKKKIQTTYIYI